MSSSDSAFEALSTDGLADPSSIEQLGRRLAEPLESLEIGMVACWYRVEDAVLAHVVARELGVQVSYAFDSEGLLSLSATVSGASVVLVGVDFPQVNDLPGLAGVVRAGNGEIRAVATSQTGLDLRGTAAENARIVDPDHK